ncbi:hypothetical protein LINPERPRIM_LOCUS8933 [Linum perenne]
MAPSSTRVNKLRQVVLFGIGRDVKLLCLWLISEFVPSCARNLKLLILDLKLRGSWGLEKLISNWTRNLQSAQSAAVASMRIFGTAKRSGAYMKG